MQMSAGDRRGSSIKAVLTIEVGPLLAEWINSNKSEYGCLGSCLVETTLDFHHPLGQDGLSEVLQDKANNFAVHKLC